MATGIFTLRNQLQALVQKAWSPTAPASTYAGSFSGSGQYLSLSATPTQFGTGDFTVEFWINPTSVSTVGTIISLSPYNANGWALGIGFPSAGVLFFYNSNGLVFSYSSISVGVWTNIAISRSGTTVRMFVNGVQVAAATDSYNYTASTLTYICTDVSAQLFKGAVSNLRVVKGTALYTSNFTPSTTPLTAVANTSLLTLQNATIIDNSTNAYTITNTGSVVTSTAYPFNITNTSTPAVEYLVVAGGGGSGKNYGSGGGGGGGLLSGILSVNAGSSLTVTVGSGGAGGTADTGTAGGNSVFSSITANGGGGGCSGQYGYIYSPTAGGSGGGGAGGYLLNPSLGGQGVFNQGNAGGTGSPNYSTYNGAGGGGAGTVGLDGTTSGGGGNGGAGIASAINGTVTAYAGGGGGGVGYGTVGSIGVGGVGGGGNGGKDGVSSPTAGTVNTGGGGGGTTLTNNGYAGGSGIVIISYPDTYNAPSALTGTYTASTSGSGSLSFSGSTTYVTGPTTSALNFGTGNFTVEFWVYATSIGTLTEFFSCTNATQDFQIALSPTNYLYWHNSGVQISNVSTPASCPLNQWNHIVFVRSGVNCALFCNGVRYGTTTNSASINLTNYYIGAYWNAVNAYNLNGYISNLRISNTAVYSPTSSTLTTPTTPFTAASSTVLLMNTVSGAQFADSSTSGLTNSATGPVNWNQASPFATGLGYKNRVYTWTGSGTVTF